jgi:ABC-type uncharacterized transport system permease subunit
MRLELRPVQSRAAMLFAPLAAIAFTLLCGALLVIAAGAPVGRSVVALIDGAFGSRFAISETLTRAIPLILTGLAAAVAFRARLYNIGAEGQLYLGALAAVAVASAGWTLPTPLLFLAMILAGAGAGALWLIGPALLKLRLGVDEVVTTLLLNFVAILFVSMLLDGPMKDPMAMGWPQSAAIPPELEFGRILERTRLHSGLLLAVGVALLLWLIQRFTVFGLALRAVGANAGAAHFAGFPVLRTVLLAAILSGAFAGLAGVVEVAGRAGYVTVDMSTGLGYAGIVIAMLAGLHPLAVVLAAVFVAAVQIGADSMSRVVGVPSYIADVIVAVALLAMLVATLLTRYRLRWGHA